MQQLHHNIMIEQIHRFLYIRAGCISLISHVHVKLNVICITLPKKIIFFDKPKIRTFRL